MTLSDGTIVWLNAESSLRFPVAFTGNERKVELTGEAYFEVSHNSKQPFKVMANGETVEDIGTHFNINAYADEPATKTTLLEGAIKVSIAGGAGVRPSPGQQTALINGHFTIKAVDPEQTIAWKNDLFDFEHATIPEIMRQASRWYDVDIVYEGSLPDKKFGGTISRNVSASKFLDILKFSGVKFRIDGKKIIVKP